MSNTTNISLNEFLCRHRLEFLLTPLRILGVDDVMDLRFVTNDLIIQLEQTHSITLTPIQKKKFESLIATQTQIAIQEEENFKSQSLREIYSSKCDSMQSLLQSQKITPEEYEEWRREEFSKLFPSVCMND